MTQITPELQEAWDRILTLDAEAKHWKHKHQTLQAEVTDMKLQINHALDNLLGLVRG